MNDTDLGLLVSIMLRESETPAEPLLKGFDGFDMPLRAYSTQRRFALNLKVRQEPHTPGNGKLQT
ncbi:hypothetical protein H8E77_31195 [bacterium]|nr:hypothetical protein [bacterium]